MPRKRRGAGEGSIYKRKDGRWAASISLGGRRRKTFYGKTRQEVSEKMKQALYEQQRGTLATGRQTKLKDYLEQWLEQVHRPEIRPQTYRLDKRNMDHHIVPALGHLTLQKLTAERVQDFYAQMLMLPLAPATIRQLHSLLHKALDTAVRWNLISRNVCDLVTLPRLVRHEMQTLSPEQARRLLSAVRSSSLEAFITLALVTGMRKGELIALHWSDVDWQEKRLHVQRTALREPGKGIVEAEPKTAASKRLVSLPGFVSEMLRQHWWAQDGTHNPLGLVFCTRRGHHLDENNLHRAWKAILQEAGLPDLRFHDLRHSAATILLSQGVPAKVVQELLGHSSINITLGTYSHVLPGMHEDAMNTWQPFFEEG